MRRVAKGCGGVDDGEVGGIGCDKERRSAKVEKDIQKGVSSSTSHTSMIVSVP